MLTGRPCRHIFLPAILVFLAASSFPLLAQDEAETKGLASDSESASKPNLAESSAPAGKIVLDEPAPPPGAIERIDRAFGSAVEVIDEILFYRLWKQERKYIVYEHREYYVRERESDQPFLKHDPHGTFEAISLRDDELHLLSAQGKLIGDDGKLHFRKGKIGDRPVEYVTIRIDDEQTGLQYGDKYVYLSDRDEYQKVVPPRGVLSSTDSLSPANVERLAEQGWLQENKEAFLESDPDYLLTEQVGGAPVVVLWLACGAVFFTLYMGGYNVWGFRHALEIVRGKYDNPQEAGEVTHFQALAAALSATVGLGNIAGVTIAMTMGGPGAFFWMILCGLFGMTSKFAECTLGQKYRMVKPDGTVLGGPMRYLRAGLAELGLEPLGLILATVFTVMCILASFGGGNMFQAKQSGKAVLAQLQHADHERLNQLDEQIQTAAKSNEIEQLTRLEKESSELKAAIESQQEWFKIAYGLMLAAMVAVVIIGGIRRIGAAAEKIVPTMCLIYVAACLWIIMNHLAELPTLIAMIFSEAFNAQAMGGGVIGVLVVGVQRAAFSNEAGVGSAAIAHSAAKTEEPIREGSVALLGPFIDTIIVCSMTALVILITGAWDNTSWIVEEGLEGAALTSQAFKSEISWFPWILSIAVVMFAYSTIISWSYYGEKCWEQLFGPRSIMAYKMLAVACVFIGSVVDAGAVLDFSDMMILSMAFPNVLGVALLSPKIKRDLADYWRRYRAGKFKTYK